MQQRALWLTSILVSACYMGPDKHEAEGVTTNGAGAGTNDATVGRDAEFDGSVQPDVGDATADAGCQSDLECPLAFPQCRDGNCAPCTEQNDCARFADTPICGPSGSCVVCTADHAQLCTGNTPACDPASHGCVQCVQDVDCTSPTQAACSASHACVPCSQDAQCTRFGKVCNVTSGACVECRPETEAMDCKSGTACNPKTFTCGTRQRESVTTCNACDSDSECISGHRCIPMMFGSTAVGNYCLKRYAAGSCPPMYFSSVTRASVSGAASETYCSVDEAKNTCPALAAFSTMCTSDESCGAVGARCERVRNVDNRCTYSCTFPADCLDNSVKCGGGGGDPYCGGS